MDVAIKNSFKHVLYKDQREKIDIFHKKNMSMLKIEYETLGLKPHPLYHVLLAIFL